MGRSHVCIYCILFIYICLYISGTDAALYFTEPKLHVSLYHLGWCVRFRCVVWIIYSRSVDTHARLSIPVIPFILWGSNARVLGSWKKMATIESPTDLCYPIRKTLHIRSALSWDVHSYRSDYRFIYFTLASRKLCAEIKFFTIFWLCSLLYALFLFCTLQWNTFSVTK